MLSQSPITTILPVTNLERARTFYERSLGLSPSKGGAQPDTAVFESGGTRLELQKRDRPTKAEHTVASFEVADVTREVSELERRGVRFEDYDMPGLKTEHHVARIEGTLCAWFKDPDGNILCIHERPH